MTTRTVERIEDWESRPFDGGYAGLQDLVDASFSGVVTAGQATACLLNGTVVGVLDGTIEDFEDASGTIREAPSPALPLLIVMQDRGDEVRAKYYSEETPLSSADQKLSDGGFTGYVELSENVLSGDYYVVYHGGKSMSVAYVGQSNQLLTDDEAFERADDEVGIYKVYPVDIEPIEVPEPETPDPDDGAAVGGGTVADDDPDPEPAATEEDDAGTDSRAPATEEGPSEPASAEAATDEAERDRGREPDRGTTPDATQDPDTAPRNGPGSGEQTAPDTREADADDEAVTGGLARRTDEDDPDRTDAAAEGSRRSTEREAETAPERRRGRATDRGDGVSEDRESRTTADRDRPTERRGGERAEGRSRANPDEQEPRERRERERRQSPTEPPDHDREASPSQSAGGETRDPAPPSGTERRAGGSDPLAGDSTSSADPLADAPDPAESASGDLEQRSIPSVDPDRTWTGDEDGPAGGLDATAGADLDGGDGFDDLEGPAGGGDPSPEPRSMEQSRESGGRQPTGQSQNQPAGRQRSGQSEELVAELREKEQTIEALEADLADLEAERDELAAEADELEAELRRVREERDDLQAEVERLQSKVSDLEAAAAASESESEVEADIQLSPQEAIEETNLFVRYGSKGEATLEAAHDGQADKEDVAANLDLEYHTSFDATKAAVGDEPFEAFLTDTIQYRFVEWVVHDLLYEIRDTGHADALRDLFDALPKLDRAELNGVVSVTYTEDGQEQRTQEAFDIVLRDRMGNPIAVANINDSRAAATDEMMTSLVTQSTRAGESHDTLAGAFFVTASFFDPDALETADEATGGGLLSRDKRESYVRLGRKQGYHLCLVEARDAKFHLAVPEL